MNNRIKCKTDSANKRNNLSITESKRGSAYTIIIVLSAIILLNIIAIILINNHLAEKESEAALQNAARQDSIQQKGSDNPSTQNAAQGTQQAGNNPETNRKTIRDQPKVKTIIMTAPDCKDCFDIMQYITELNNTINMDIEYATPDAIGIMPKRLPALLFNNTFGEYSALTKDWNNSGTIEQTSKAGYKGTWYVLPTVHAPFKETDTGKIKGRIGVTYITIAACSECYNISLLKEALKESKITPYSEITIDAQSTEGKKLVAKYNITRVPTLIMDKEAGYHSQLFPGWFSAGTVESDGTLVLRQLERMRVTYYDLRYNETMKP